MREVTNVPNIYRKNKMEAVSLCRAFFIIGNILLPKFLNEKYRWDG